MSLYDKMLFLGNMEDIEGLLHEVDALRAELAKYRGMEVELAALKNDLEALRRAWSKSSEQCLCWNECSCEVGEAKRTMARIIGGK